MDSSGWDRHNWGLEGVSSVEVDSAHRRTQLSAFCKMRLQVRLGEESTRESHSGGWRTAAKKCPHSVEVSAGSSYSSGTLSMPPNCCAVASVMDCCKFG